MNFTRTSASLLVAAVLVTSPKVGADPPPSAPLTALPPLPPPSSDGRRATIAGAVLLGISATLVLGSIPLWTRGFGPIGSAFGGTMDAIGVATFIPGAVLLPIGLVQASRYRRWYRQSSPQSFELSPMASPTANGVSVGLQARF